MVRTSYVRRVEAPGEIYEVTNVEPDCVSAVAFSLVLMGTPSTLSGLAIAEADVHAAQP